MNNAVSLHTHVDIELVDEAGAIEKLAFDLVADDEADFARGFLGIGTPLAQVLLGHTAGDEVSYRAGDVVAVRVLQVSPGAAAPPADVVAEREAVIRKAVARSEVLNDAAFALAAGSKWGNYDPEAVADEHRPSAAQDQGTRRRKQKRSPERHTR